MATVQINIQAIRLTNDLLAERGDWLVIYPDDRVVVLNQTEAAKLGLRRATAPLTAPERPPKSRAQPRPNGATASPTARQAPSAIPPHQHRVSVDINGKRVTLRRGGFVVLEAMYGWPKLQYIGALNASGDASEMKRLGFIEAHRDPDAEGRLRGGKRIMLWQLTNNGREIVRRVHEQPAKE